MPQETKESAVVQEHVQRPNDDQWAAPTIGLLVFLIVALFVLKKFIYIRDDKRDGK